MLKHFIRQNFYLLLGISLGYLSGTFSPFDFYNACSNGFFHEISNPFKTIMETNDQFEPRIRVGENPLQVAEDQNNLKVLRPRYFSTELGIKKKLFVAVLTTQKTVNTFGVALNKTAAHLVDKMIYFIDAAGAQKLNVSYLKLPGIVGFIDTRVALKPFHVLKYIKDNFIDGYDFFFFVNDRTYLKTRILNDIIRKVSVSQDVYAGTPAKNPKYCSFNAGVLLSSSVMQSMLFNIDWCVKNVFTLSHDDNFGKCVVYASNIECQTVVQREKFTSFHLAKGYQLNSRILESDAMNIAVSVYPVKDDKTFYILHGYFSTKQLSVTDEKISELRESIKKTARFTPSGNASVTWPIGNQPGNTPLTRFDLLRWNYFTETHIYLTDEFSTVKLLNSAEKQDIQNIIAASVATINSKYSNIYRFHSLMNGYRRFDPSRGMDYKLDIIFQKLYDGSLEHKRVDICKPLGKVELLPVPYVTENRRVNVILPIKVKDREFAESFLDQYKSVCLEKKEKVFLVLVFIYDLNAPGKGTKDDVFVNLKNRAQVLSEMYKKDDSKVIWLSIKIPFADNQSAGEAFLNFAVLDLSLRKFPPESLIMLGTPNMEIKVDYLNRVRMNTILGWQVFCPIPFFEYNPIIRGDRRQNFVDLNKNSGHFDSLNTDHISFFVKDYFAARHKMKNLLPLVKDDSDIKLFHQSTSNQRDMISIATHTIYSMFVQFGDLHLMRAVESALRLKYRERDCSLFSSITDNTVAALRKMCISVRNANLGSRGQLARLLLEYQETNKIRL